MKLFYVILIGNVLSASVSKLSAHPSVGIYHFPQKHTNVKKAAPAILPQSLNHEIHHNRQSIASMNELPTLDQINQHNSMKRTNSDSDSHKPTKTTTYTIKPKNEQGYFAKTSSENRKTAWTALGAFVSGFILLWLSIVLICYNERESVKNYSYTVWLENNLNEPNQGSEKIDESKPYIVKGPLNIIENPTLKGFEEEIAYLTNNNQKLAIIKLCIEQEINEQNEEGIENEENKEVPINWGEVKDQSRPLKSEVEYGRGLIGAYELDLKSLDFEGLVGYKYKNVNLNNEKTLEKMKNYVINKIGIENSTDFECNNDYLLFKVIKDKTENKFKMMRVSLMYYGVNSQNNTDIFTIVGGFKKNKLEILDSQMKRAECSFCLCCFGESKDSYKVYELLEGEYTKESYIKLKRDINTCLTNLLRICGFLLHFLSYYLILYPLISLLGMIPFLGAVAATILILFAFLLAVVTFLFIIACAWICARPILAIFIFTGMFIFIWLSKQAKDKYGQKGEFEQNHHTGRTSNKFL